MAGVIVHEWLERHGGAEKVVDAMASAFPDAAIHCLWNDAPERLRGRAVTESWLAMTPLRRSKAAALAFMPTTWARTDVRDKDFVLVSSHLFAHHVGGRMGVAGPPKFVYVHTPARYIWVPDLDARGKNPLARAMAPMLRAIDAKKAHQGACFAANSRFVRDRIRAAWDQDATVIYPPVDVARLQSVNDWRDRLSARDEATLASLPSTFLLGASRFIRYKRLELVIRAGEAAGLPVVLAGTGPQRDFLAAAGAHASVPVHIVDGPSDSLLYALYQAAAAYVFPGVEDFGIMPIEAMSLGTPVIVSNVGGAAEGVAAVGGGVILESTTSHALRSAVDSALRLDMAHVRTRTRAMFAGDEFAKRLKHWMGLDAPARIAPETRLLAQSVLRRAA